MTQWYLAGLIRLLAGLQEASVVAATGATTMDSPTFTDDVNPSLLVIGMTISSPQFPAGTTVLNKVGATVTMSANATATETSPDALVTGVLPAGILEPVSLNALTEVPPSNPDTVFGDLVLADFNGYAPLELTPGGTQISGALAACLRYDCITWTPSNYAVPNSIAGVAFTIPGTPDPILLASETFETAVQLATPGQVLSMIPILNVPYAGGGLASPIIG